MKLFKKAEFWLGVVILFHVGINLIWLGLDKTPPAWDQAAHLRMAVLVGQKFLGETPLSWLSIIRSGYGYPPLGYILGGLWGVVWGVGIIQITIFNTLILGLLLVGCFLLAKEVLKNKWWALFLVVIFSLIPVIYDLSRSFLLDLILLALVVWGMFFWLKNNVIGVWLMLVLASLTKLNGFIYFLPILIWYIWQTRESEKLLLKLVIGGIIYLLVVGWWWGINFQNILAYTTGLAGSGEKLTDPMNLGEWQTWIHYIRLFFWTQMTPIAAMIVMVLMMFGRKFNWKLWGYLIINYLIFTVIKNKDYRFTLPLIPVAVLMAVSGLRSIPRNWQWGAGGMLVIYLFGFFINNSFNWPIKKPNNFSVSTFLMGNGDLINISDYPVKSPKNDKWPNQEIISYLVGEGVTTGRQKVLVLIDWEQINDNNLKLYRELLTNRGDGAVELHSIYKLGFDSWQDFDLVLIGEKESEPAPFYATNLEALIQARDYIWNNRERFVLQKEFSLPNNQIIYLMKII